MADAPRPEPTTGLSRRVLASIGLASLAVFLVLWLFLLTGSFLACDGDGGSPYAAPDSPVGQLCEARGKLPWRVLWGVLALAAAGIALRAVALAIGRRSGRVLARMLALAAGLTATLTIPFMALSTECSSEKQAANERWGRDHPSGEVGDEPYDCEHY